MTQASATLIASIRECDAKMGALKDAEIESGRGTQVILVATDLLAEQRSGTCVEDQPSVGSKWLWALSR